MNSNNKEYASFRIIPKSQKKCVWMEIGIVSYKICDRNFKCDDCPLDKGLRGDSSIMNYNQKDFNLSKTKADKGQPPSVKNKSSLEYLIKLKLDEHYYVHPGHSWIKVLSQKRVKVGIDDIVATTLGSIDSVILPLPGEKIRRGANCGQIIQFEHIFSVVAPLSGQVVQVNQELADFPNKLTLDPLNKGWMIMIKPDNLDQDLKICRSGDVLISWYLKEFKWLECNLNKSFQQESLNLGTTLYDGGEISRNLRNYLPKEHYRRLIINLLGVPNTDT